MASPLWTVPGSLRSLTYQRKDHTMDHAILATRNGNLAPLVEALSPDEGIWIGIGTATAAMIYRAGMSVITVNRDGHTLVAPTPNEAMAAQVLAQASEHYVTAGFDVIDVSTSMPVAVSID